MSSTSTETERAFKTLKERVFQKHLPVLQASSEKSNDPPVKEHVLLLRLLKDATEEVLIHTLSALIMDNKTFIVAFLPNNRDASLEAIVSENPVISSLFNNEVIEKASNRLSQIDNGDADQHNP